MALNREQILAVAASGRRQTESVHVPDLGGDVYVRTITAAERERWEAISGLGGKLAPRIVRAALVAIAASDEAGNALFTEADISTLAELPFRAIEPLYDAAMDLNRMKPADVEKLEGESGASPSNDSAAS